MVKGKVDADGACQLMLPSVDAKGRADAACCSRYLLFMIPLLVFLVLIVLLSIVLLLILLLLMVLLSWLYCRCFCCRGSVLDGSTVDASAVDGPAVDASPIDAVGIDILKLILPAVGTREAGDEFWAILGCKKCLFVSASLYGFESLIGRFAGR